MIFRVIIGELKVTILNSRERGFLPNFLYLLISINLKKKLTLIINMVVS